MPRPLPSAVNGFGAGTMSGRGVKYPKLPKSIPIKTPHVTYPGLSKCGKAPATKLPMGMTLPIMTKAGGHQMESTTQLPKYGHGTH